MTCRLRRGSRACSPMGQKKASGTTKKALIAHFAAVFAISRAKELDSFPILLESAHAHLFSSPKWACLPSVAYRRTASPRLAWGRNKGMRVGWLWCGEGIFAAPINKMIFVFHRLVRTHILRPRMPDKFFYNEKDLF